MHDDEDPEERRRTLQSVNFGCVRLLRVRRRVSTDCVLSALLWFCCSVVLWFCGSVFARARAHGLVGAET
jgi:hypothetical protein